MDPQPQLVEKAVLERPLRGGRRPAAPVPPGLGRRDAARRQPLVRRAGPGRRRRRAPGRLPRRAAHVPDGRRPIARRRRRDPAPGRLGPSPPGPVSTAMRKLIESTLVSLDGVIESPDRWAPFDDDATRLALKDLGNYDAFVMGRVTYERFRANWAPVSGNRYIDRINAMPNYVASRSLAEVTWNATLLGARRRRRDRAAKGPAGEGPHQVRH